MKPILSGLFALSLCSPVLAQEVFKEYGDESVEDEQEVVPFDDPNNLLTKNVNLPSDCTNLMTAVSQISASLDQAQLDEASVLASKAREDLSCQEKPVSNLVLTSVFHLSGAVHMFLGEEKQAWEAFGFSASMAPMATINPVLGSQATETHEILRQSVLAAPQGQIQFAGNAEVWLDGKPAEIGPSIDMPAGQHFLQWKAEGQPMQNRVIRVESGEARAIPVGPGAESFKGDSFGGVKFEAKHWALIGGGAAVVTGGVLLALGFKARADFDSAAEADLETAAQKANTLLIAGGATAGLGLSALIAGPMFLADGSPGFQVGFVW